MKKLVIYATLGFLGWLGVCTAWAVTARATGLPGPARAALATMDAAADALESLDLPASLAASRRLAARQVRSSGRALTRVYTLPERIATRLIGARSHWHGDRWNARAGGGWPNHAPAARAAEVDAELARRIEALAPRIEARIARIEVVAPRLEEEIARKLELRLERLRNGEVRVRRMKRTLSVERSASRFER